MTFWKTVGAYLTGWLIVMPIYNRLRGAWARRELGNPSSETLAWARVHGDAIADVLMERGLGQGRQIEELRRRVAVLEGAVYEAALWAATEAFERPPDTPAGVIAVEAVRAVSGRERADG